MINYHVYILNPFFEDSWDDFFIKAYKYGSLDKVLVCHPESVSVFETMDWNGMGLGNNNAPEIIPSKRAHKLKCFVIDRNEWEVLKCAF